MLEKSDAHGKWMYDPRDTQPVRRSELRSKSSSPDLSPSSDRSSTQWRVQLDLIYKDRDTEQDNAKSEKDHSAFTEAPDEEEYAFRLFSTRSGQSQASKNQPPKIRIRSPETVSCDPGFVQSWRPEGYYFSKHSDTLREQYKAIAIEGEDVLNEAQAKWPGFELPWRVTTLSTKQFKPSKGTTTAAQAEATGKRKRNGKKRRISIRVKTQGQRDKEEKLKLAESRKNEAKKEKRNRKNREKKIKRREKARAMKKDRVSSTVTGD